MLAGWPMPWMIVAEEHASDDSKRDTDFAGDLGIAHGAAQCANACVAFWKFLRGHCVASAVKARPDVGCVGTSGRVGRAAGNSDLNVH